MCLIIIFVLLFAGFLQAAGWSVRPFEKATGYGTNGKSCEGSTGLREVGCPCDGVGYNCKDPLSRCLGSNGLQGNSAKMKVNQQGVCVCAPLAAFYNTTTGDCQTASEDDCVLEYTVDFAQGKVIPGARATIPKYFGTNGDLFMPPVNFAYMSLPRPESTFFALHMNNRERKQQVICATDASVTSGGVRCPYGEIPTGVERPISLASSVSSQLFLGDPSGNLTIVHFAVQPGTTEINLYNNDFSSLYSSTDGFLRGQSKIKAITAIQIANDPTGSHSDRLIVFGTGSDGTTPYVGFVTMLLTGVPTVLLNDTSAVPASHPKFW